MGGNYSFCEMSKQPMNYFRDGLRRKICISLFFSGGDRKTSKVFNEAKKNQIKIFKMLQKLGDIMQDYALMRYYAELCNNMRQCHSMR